MKTTKKSIIIYITVACLILISIAGIAFSGFMRTYKHEFSLTINVGKIDLSLAEATTDFIVPGTTITLSENPSVTVGKNSQACWLFIEVIPTADFNSYLSYDSSITEGWTPLTDVQNVYYRQLPRSEQDETFTIMEDTTLEILPTLTDKQISAAQAQSITIKAYAVQDTEDTSTPILAWMQIRP